MRAARTTVDETLDLLPGEPRLRIRVEGVERGESDMGRRAEGSRRRGQGLVGVDAAGLAPDAAGAARSAEVAAVLGLGTGGAGAAKSLAHLGYEGGRGAFHV